MLPGCDIQHVMCVDAFWFKIIPSYNGLFRMKSHHKLNICKAFGTSQDVMNMGFITNKNIKETDSQISHTLEPAGKHLKISIMNVFGNLSIKDEANR